MVGYVTFTLPCKNDILFYTQEGLQSSASLNKNTTYHKKWIWFQFTKIQIIYTF